MKSIYRFAVKPIGERYNNAKSIGDKSLILNTEIFNHQYVNRLAEVISVPMYGETLGIEAGDKAIIHHNVFRRWHDIRGKERNSSSWFNDELYLISTDQIYLIDKGNGWQCPEGWTFIRPVVDEDVLASDIEKEKVGIVEYSDRFSKGDLVGLKSGYKHEFIIDDKKLYRSPTRFITIKYGNQGNKKAYNPSWAQSS